MVEDIEVKKFSVGSGDVQNEREAMTKLSRSENALEGRTARAIFKALQVAYSCGQKPLSVVSTLADKCLLQYFWISGDGASVTLCNEQALGCDFNHVDDADVFADQYFGKKSCILESCEFENVTSSAVRFASRAYTG